MRIATDLAYHRDDVPVVPLLAPFVRPQGRGDTPWDRRFDGWRSIGSSRHELVDDIADADLVVVPTDWYWVRGPSWASRPDRRLAGRLSELHRRARSAGIPTLVHFTGDRSCDRVGLPGAFVLREGAFESRRGPGDLALPAFAEDLVAEHLGGHAVVRTLGERPVVGFCGLAAPRRGAAQLARRVVYAAVVGAREHRVDPSPYLGENLRLEALALLEASERTETNFVVRDSSVFFRDASTSDLVDVRREYVENLAGCDYVLCVRGSGNYSYRLYEALCMGRIPIVIDTDLALPFADSLPWNEITVQVAVRDIGRIDEIVAEHHRGLDDATYRALQGQIREVWLGWLAPEAFYGRLARVLAIA